MGKIDYNLKDIDPDTLYNLLPYVDRATDPNDLIRVLFNSLEVFHNHAIEKARQMPRVQDPDKCAKFSPADFGESVSDYEEMVTLIYRDDLALLSDAEKSYMEQLRAKLPRSMKARDKEITYLGMLAESIGVKTFSRFFINILRAWIKTGILRHHINGTHSSVFLLGRVLGFIDLKVAELWSRFATKDPDEPKALRNLHDFMYVSEQFPHKPDGEYYLPESLYKDYEREDGNGNAYVNLESIQTPLANIFYNPNVLDDAESEYIVEFPYVSPLLTSRLHINLLLNGHNPFGNFTDVVEKKLKTGTYRLSGGSAEGKGFVEVPTQDGSTTYRFTALATGDWSSQVVLSVENNVASADICEETNLESIEGIQKITLSGPQSRIKFKTSLFDLVTAIDPVNFTLYYPATEVTPVLDLQVVASEFEYSVDVANNTLHVTTEEDSGLAVGDHLKIASSTSQMDLQGFEVDRNRDYTVLSTSNGGTEVVLEMFSSQNSTRDIGAYGHHRTPVVSIEDDTDVVLHFNEVIPAEEDEEIRVVGDTIYDGTYLAKDVTETSLKLYSTSLSGMVPYAGSGAPLGFVITVGGGYADGVIPDGEGSVETNGSLIKVMLAGSPSPDPAFPLLGPSDGLSEQSTGANFKLNILAYFEIVAIVREMFEGIRPLSRTIRKEFNGLYFRDDIHYAPHHVQPYVILRSSNGTKWRLRVGKDYRPAWTVDSSDDPPITVVQRDAVLEGFYRWHINDAGEFSVRRIPSFGADSVLVLIEALDDTTDTSAHVYLSSGSLTASLTSPEFSVESIHLVDGSESYLADDLNDVVESIPESLAQWMGEEASSTDTPSSTFAFASGPEDELEQNRFSQDFALGHVAAEWLNDVKLQWLEGKLVLVQPVTTNNDGFHEGLWYHPWASFKGYDPRWDHRGINRGVVVPVPSGTGAGTGLDSDYPVRYLDYHNLYAWRSRDEDDLPWTSSYLYEAPEAGAGGERVDTDMSHFDGPMEPTSSSGPPLHHVVEIEYPWKKEKTTITTTPDKSFTSVTDASGRARVEFPDDTDLTGVYAGMQLLFEESSVHSSTSPHQVIEVGSNYITTSAPFVEDESGSLWIKVVELDLWESTSSNTVTLDLSPAGNEFSGAVDWKVYGGRTSVEITDLLAEGSLSYDREISQEIDYLTGTVSTSKRTITAWVKSGANTFSTVVTLGQEADIGVLAGSVYGGDLPMAGGDRDHLEITLMPWDDCSLNFNIDTASTSTVETDLIAFSSTANPTNHFVEVAGPTRSLWRGGHWGVSGLWGYDSTNRDGVPPLMTLITPEDGLAYEGNYLVFEGQPLIYS